MKKHNRADEKCDGCRPGYPQPCDKEGCGGLIHASPGCIIETQCDRCPPEVIIGKEENHA